MLRTRPGFCSPFDTPLCISMGGARRARSGNLHDRGEVRGAVLHCWGAGESPSYGGVSDFRGSNSRVKRTNDLCVFCVFFISGMCVHCALLLHTCWRVVRTGYDSGLRTQTTQDALVSWQVSGWSAR